MTNHNNHYKSKGEKTEEKSSLSNNKSFLYSPIFIAIAFTIIGFTAATFTYKIAAERQKNNLISEIREANDSEGFIETVERKSDTFVNNFDKNLKAIEKEAKKEFSHKNIDTNAVVSMHEDDKNYFYELKFSGFNKDDILVKIDKSINFSAKVKKESNEKNEKTSSSSSFEYSFSLPSYDKKVKPEITREDNKIIVKLAKPKPKAKS